jgi:hypothetical protein
MNTTLKTANLHLQYKEQSDLSLKIIEGEDRWYEIIKNRESATDISPEINLVSKVVIPYMLEKDMKIAIFDQYDRIKIRNFSVK